MKSFDLEIYPYDMSTFKAIMYDIAELTSFVFTRYIDYEYDGENNWANLDSVAWLSWHKDLLEISKSYPNTVIELGIVDDILAQTCWTRNGKSYITNDRNHVFDESLLKEQ